MCGETDEDVRKAELWFENARPYAPSPFMPRIKGTRDIQLQILCNFGEDEPTQKVEASNSAEESAPESLKHTIPEAKLISAETTEEVSTYITPQADVVALDETKENISSIILNEALIVKRTKFVNSPQMLKFASHDFSLVGESASSSLPMEAVQGADVCTPAPQKQIENKKAQTAKKIASMLKNPSAMNSRNRLQKSQVNNNKPASVRRDTNVKSIVGTHNFAHENHAIKRQKLEGGKSRQILTVNKPLNLPHKTRTGVISSSSNFCLSTAKTRKEDRKMYVREPAAPFVSMAEMMRKFQSGTREVSLPRTSSLSQSDISGANQRKPKLTLTRPKTPEFETSQRVRSVKIKSSTELEEEMMAKIPKFKARPLNKKIFEAPTLPPLPRSAPQPPEFKEFHLETMSRANQNAETSTVASTESIESHQWKSHLTAPKSPVLQTSLRARPARIKSSEELEKEELENIPQFKARPLNRKIFESKGDMGIFCNSKKQVTIPQEFHFAIDKRIPPPTAVVDLFDKLSISSEPHQEKPLPKNTTPNPFHLHTEERGADKEKRMVEELMQKQLEEERARVPKAHPYPYTTDYPVIPPKPEPKPCTKPEPFQLESLMRHEEEMQREMEEKRRREIEEAQMRIFKAQPILKEDPIPVPEKVRRPLTEVQEFNLNVNHRAVDRAEFDKKLLPRLRRKKWFTRDTEEAESARMMEEEKALKQLRRTLVPHARPVPNFDHPFLPQKYVS
ncbi:UNVERIFIED_CONTAM: protein TPX2 [Sesamum angustifolium]|uniref:Protein TPX2 n=1 Tax=Sesamum angustifolium TaxID=2727405 RepID=A0AAW2PEA0_9LAMI